MHKRVPCPPAVRYFDFRVSLFSLTSVGSISNCILQILTASVNFFAVLLIRKQSIEKDVISMDSCSTEVACPVSPCDVILKSVFFFTLQCAEALQNVGRRWYSIWWGVWASGRCLEVQFSAAGAHLSMLIPIFFLRLVTGAHTVWSGNALTDWPGKVLLWKW